jgi:uncharacterized iron-regulated membrane protein
MHRRRTIKYWIGQLHLWLGLISGLVVFIVSITGCLFVFQQEITEGWHKKWYFVTPQPHTLPVSQLLQKAQTALGPDEPIGNIVIYRKPDRTWEFMAYKQKDGGITIFGSLLYYRSVFVDPYTGAVTGIRNYKYDFFFIVKYLHWSLLLDTPYGQPIVGWSTFIFVILLLTGLVLWWPKKWTKVFRERSFKIKWKASFRRVNYDLHNVPGWYSLLPALVISLTGLVFSFNWFTALVYLVTTGATAPPAQAAVHSILPDSTITNTVPAAGPAALVDAAMSSPAADPLDRAFLYTWEQTPGARRFAFYPAYDKESVISVYAYKGQETYYGYDVLRFDRYTGQLLHRRNDRELNAGERLVGMNYDIHVGAIGGLTGKIIAFIVSLICASLPVSGFLIWWGKRNKGKSPSSRRTMA